MRIEPLYPVPIDAYTPVVNLDPLMDDRRKRILYQATHRGMKETDRIVGGFVTENVANLSDLQLDYLDELLNQPDADILNWLYDRTPLPDNIDASIFDLIKDFNHNM